VKAARVHRVGPPSVITIDDLPRTEPAPGELLVHVKAAGVELEEARIAHEMLGGAPHKRGTIVLSVAA
jgi:NADPH:quinone reductase-like Zn-dependent oxidoreductase